MFSALALTAVAGISVASVISCTTSKNNSSSITTKTSSSSANSNSTNEANTNQDIANALVTYFNQTTMKVAVTEAFQTIVQDIPVGTSISIIFSNTSIKAALVGILTEDNTSSTTISYNGTSYTGSEYNTADIEITNIKYDSTTEILTFDISYSNEASTLGALTYNI